MIPWWAPVLALFELPVIGNIFAGLIALFSVSILGVFIPSVKALALGVVLLLAAYFIPDVTIFKSKRVKISIRNVLGIASVMCFIMVVFGITPAGFGAGTITNVASVMPAGTVTDDISASLKSIVPPEIKPESLTTIVVVFITTIAATHLMGAMAGKKRRKR